MIWKKVKKDFNDRHFYVYLHRKEDDNIPFYVGKGKYQRAWNFYNRSKWWHRIKSKHGVKVEILENNLSETESFEREKHYITLFRDTLCNLSPGGRGGDLFRFVDREKHKASINKIKSSEGGRKGGSKGGKISSEIQRIKNLGFFNSEIQSKNGTKGGLAHKGISKEFNTVICPHCGKIGKDCAMYRWHFDKCKFKKQTSEEHDALIISRKRGPLSNEHKTKISTALRGRKLTPEIIAKRLLATKVRKELQKNAPP